MTNSRTKGSKNERGVSKLLHQWSGYEFARTPQSGGLHWKKQHTSGDVVCIDEDHGKRYPFSFEAKFHKELDLLNLIDHKIGKKSNKITLFWDQTCTDASLHKKIPILLMRRNHQKADTHFVVLSTNFFLLWMAHLEPTHFKLGIFHFTTDQYTFTIINSEDLFSADYKVFYKLGKKVYRSFLKHPTNDK